MLHSASSNETGVPQQLLDAKQAELKERREVEATMQVCACGERLQLALLLRPLLLRTRAACSVARGLHRHRQACSAPHPHCGMLWRGCTAGGAPAQAGGSRAGASSAGGSHGGCSGRRCCRPAAAAAGL